MPLLKYVLNEAKKELEKKGRIREEAQTDMRFVINRSKQAILQIHQKKMQKAKKLIQEASEITKKLETTSNKHAELIYGGFYSAALQEYSEANIFLNLIERQEFVAPKEINVPAADYVLGLADVIGEYRRLTLDYLREGNVKKGDECLQIMDEIFTELMTLDETLLVSGLRRKNDVARKIIEITRGDITQETRISTFEEHLKHLEKRIEKKE